MTRARIHQATTVAALPLALRKALATSQRVVLPGVGIFWVSERPARNVRNPATKALMRLPATREVRFRAVKAMRKAVAL